MSEIMDPTQPRYRVESRVPVGGEEWHVRAVVATYWEAETMAANMRKDCLHARVLRRDDDGKWREMDGKGEWVVVE